MLVKRYLIPSEFMREESWRLLEWCKQRGADEFTIDRQLKDAVIGPRNWTDFEIIAEPFSRGVKKRECMTGRTADELVRDTEVWELNQVTAGALTMALPGGLLDYEPREGGWFEDPILYRAGGLMLGVLSREAFAVLRVSGSEVNELAEAGFSSHESLPRISDTL
jgi:hypothetical protein